MINVILKSVVFSTSAVFVMLLVRNTFKTESFIIDAGGLSVFSTFFGTLYGIMIAFVVFEVWSQFNKSSEFIEKEAQGLERLFRLSLYFRNNILSKKMKQAIENYANVVIKGKFNNLAEGKRNATASKTFRKIVGIIRGIRFDDERDNIIFDHLISHYGNLSEMRTKRLHQSLVRMPKLLKAFIYISSVFTLIAFIFMPFSNFWYGVISTGSFSFTVAMIFQLIEDLDNPFAGFWRITTEPFERALKHIEEDYI